MSAIKTNAAQWAAESRLRRRQILAGGAALLFLGLFPQATLGKSATPFRNLDGLATRRLWLFNPHTQETIDKVYWRDGGYEFMGLGAVDWFFRDFRTGTIREIDCLLLDMIASMHLALGRDTPFTMLSGYRSRKTNEWLIEQGVGASPNSYHIKGQAADLHLEGVSAKALRKTALERQIGGLGYYPNNGFIHVDSGRKRQWTD